MKKKKTPSKKRMSIRLDNVVREYIKLRDQDCCRTCGIHKDSTISGTLDWSHKISRNNLHLRWDERNGVAQCRCCHNKWSMGMTIPLNNAIDSLWGVGTAEALEMFAGRHPTIKGTQLDSVDYRLKLESLYKKKIKAIKEGFMSSIESMKTIWEENDLEQFKTL